MSMTVYAPWWDADITLYNRAEDADGLVTWYKSQHNGCFYTMPRQRQFIGAEIADADTQVCRIRQSESYRKPEVWAKLDDAGKAAYFTVCTGDIIVPGLVDDTIDENEDGLRSSDLLEKYKRAGAFRLAGAQDNTGTAYGSPHYRGTGVE